MNPTCILAQLAPLVICVVVTWAVNVVWEHDRVQNWIVRLQASPLEVWAADTTTTTATTTPATAPKPSRSDDNLSEDIFQVERETLGSVFLAAMVEQAEMRCAPGNGLQKGSDAIDCQAVIASTAKAKRELRIFVYDLPAQFNIGLYEAIPNMYKDHKRYRHPSFLNWLRHPFMAMEQRLHESMLHSPYRTHDITNATLFFVPLYTAALWGLVRGSKYKGEYRQHIEAAYSYLESTYPLYIRRGYKKRNHIIVQAFDQGNLYWPKSVPDDQFIFVGSSFRNHIRTPACCVWYYQDIKRDAMMVGKAFEAPGRKQVDLMFSGSREDASRQVFYDLYTGWINSSIPRPASVTNLSEPLRWPNVTNPRGLFPNSTTCWCPPGWASSLEGDLREKPSAEWTGRDVQSVFVGCVPVFLNKTLFLTRFIRWNSFAINMPGRSEPYIKQSVAEIEKLVADDPRLKRVQERLYFAMPFLTAFSTPARKLASNPERVMDMLTLVYAELVHWIPPKDVPISKGRR